MELGTGTSDRSGHCFRVHIVSLTVGEYNQPEIYGYRFERKLLCHNSTEYFCHKICTFCVNGTAHLASIKGLRIGFDNGIETVMFSQSALTFFQSRIPRCRSISLVERMRRRFRRHQDKARNRCRTVDSCPLADPYALLAQY